MSYVSDIRAKIGHAALMLVSAAVLIARGDEVLLMRRSDNGLWGYHGGAVEPGETVEEAARRELYEESGLTAGKMRLFAVSSGPSQHVYYPNGDEVYYTEVLYLCEDYTGEPLRSNEEVLEQRWFALACLPESISPSLMPQLHQYAAGRIAGL